MAKFRTVKTKEKRYVFDFLANRGDDNPAAVVFSRFPKMGEDFMPKIKSSVFDGIDLEKASKKDSAETEKFTTAIMAHFTGNFGKADYEYFSRECIDHFENFDFDGKEIKTVDDFIALPVELWMVIANDCYKYAMEKDEFAVGEYSPS